MLLLAITCASFAKVSPSCSAKTSALPFLGPSLALPASKSAFCCIRTPFASFLSLSNWWGGLLALWEHKYSFCA